MIIKINFQDATFVASCGLASQFPPSNGMEFVVSGRSNVGKSSLLNKLFYRKSLARVSSVPGKTATINFYRLDDVYLVDLPGYGYAKVSKSEKKRWATLIQCYFEQSRDLSLVIQLIDMRHPPTELDLQMIDYFIAFEIPFLVVLTKADKLNKTQYTTRLELIKQELPCGDQITIIPCSTQTNQGIESLRDMMTECLQDFQNADVIDELE